ncbi:uncharacterized protein B0P05DRAFT_540716 [Gilbertella persicaria]|uniref:uncharacterized protein n=1 Tax=Gilbertella persicaria TaxID=101096 RepID=UPI00221F8860|nr:uncharacterized protein B0P05DRAFT_540716 [Gilbertella persicaria]KAI8080283.1 hypothetical protein B0P05DRAFT_540716 [Gilbertella persicaria]
MKVILFTFQKRKKKVNLNIQRNSPLFVLFNLFRKCSIWILMIKKEVFSYHTNEEVNKTRRNAR